MTKKIEKQKHGEKGCPFGFRFNDGVVLSDNPSLQDAVDVYVRGYRPYLANVLALFKNCSFDEALKAAAYACCPVCRRRYGHERRITNDSLTDFHNALLEQKMNLLNADSFEMIMDIVGEIGKKISGIGTLTAYDCAIRIGANLGKLPQKFVYAHRGATIRERRGRKLQHQFARTEFRQELDELTAYEIEDFLCVFHKEREKGLFTVLK